MTTAEATLQPLISVILNTFNRAQLVRRAIDSVLAQTYPNLELIVVDDGSTDDTEEVLAEENDPRFRYIRQENSGLSAGRNRGFAVAAGAWIACLDDDDQVEPEWLGDFVAHMAEDVGIVFSGHQRVDVRTGQVEVRSASLQGPALLSVTGDMLAGTWIMRAEVFRAAGGFRESLPTLVQTEFMLRAIPVCIEKLGLRTSASKAAHFQYSVLPPMERPTLTPALAYEAGVAILEAHPEAFARDRKARADWNSVVGVSALRCGNRTAARRHLWRAVCAQPYEWRRWMRFVGCQTSITSGLIWETSVAR